MLKRFLTISKPNKKKSSSDGELEIEERIITDEPYTNIDVSGTLEQFKEMSIVLENGIPNIVVDSNLVDELELKLNKTNPFNDDFTNTFKQDDLTLTTSEEPAVGGVYPPIWYTKRTDLLPFGDGSNKLFGFENFGNTCYCNSVLQCLFNLSDFRSNLLQYPVRDPSIERKRKTEMLGKKAKNFDTLNPKNSNDGNNKSRFNSFYHGFNNSSSKLDNGEDKSFSKQSKQLLTGFLRRSENGDVSMNDNSMISTSEDDDNILKQNQYNEVNEKNNIINTVEEGQIVPNSKVVIVGRNVNLNDENGGLYTFNKTKMDNDNFNGDISEPSPIHLNNNGGLMKRPKSHYETIEGRKKAALFSGPIVNIDYPQFDTETPTLYGTLKDVFECITEQTSLTGVVSPEQFIRTFRKENVLFNSMMHQDAHEFLNFLLNQLSESIDAANITSTSLKSPNFIKDLFQGSLSYRVKCLTCDNVTTRDEPFLDFPIEVQGDEATDIQEVLKNYHQKEMLNGSNKFYCDVCCGLQEAERVVGLKQLPQTLSLHLKRFKYSERTNNNIKLFNKTYYPLKLDVTSIFDLSVSKHYKLTGIVIHMGGGPQHGHYISLCKTDKFGWLLFDDETVETVREEDVLKFMGDPHNMSTAYILFYKAEEKENFVDETKVQEKYYENISQLIKCDDMLRRTPVRKIYNRDGSPEQDVSYRAESYTEDKSTASQNRSGSKRSKFFGFKKS